MLKQMYILGYHFHMLFFKYCIKIDIEHGQKLILQLNYCKINKYMNEYLRVF